MAKYTKIYWRSTGVPTWGLVFLTVVAIAVFLVAENLQQRDEVVEEHYTTMVAASRTMRNAMDVLMPERAKVAPISPDFDPQRSGLIGVPASSVTSNHGGRESKQTTINPNWAAVGVKLLKQAGVEEGDLVAVTVSGSFPALNLAMYSAIEAIGAEAVVIASASSSQWGANVPGFLWLDMERILRDRNIISLKPVAVSLGAIEDRGIGLEPDGIASIKTSINRSGIPFLQPQSYREAVAERIALFRQHAEGRPYKAFVNVGGGATIVGPPGIDDQFNAGLIYDAPARAYAVETVMGHFLREEVPGIHMINVKTLAERYGLPLAPEQAIPVGNAGVYNATTYRRWLAAVLGLGLFGITWLVVRSARITSVFRRTGESGKSVRPMV